MRGRQVNCLRHDMTSTQALSMLLDMWTQNRALPVILITRRRCAESTIRHIRTILAKERKKYKNRGHAPYYGFTCSKPFNYTEGRVKGEAIVIRWRVTKKQRMRNMIPSLFGKDKV